MSAFPAYLFPYLVDLQNFLFLMFLLLLVALSHTPTLANTSFQHRNNPPRADIHLSCWFWGPVTPHSFPALQQEAYCGLPSPLQQITKTFSSNLLPVNSSTNSVSHQQAFSVNITGEQDRETGNTQASHSKNSENRNQGTKHSPTKTNLEISTQTYNHPQTRWLESSVKE